LAPTTVSAQAFGRFGYVSLPATPGIELKNEGFRARHPMADMLKFKEPIARSVPLEIGWEQGIYGLRGGSAAPDKLRVNLFSPGVDIYVESGLELTVTSAGAPYLSFPGGTVTPELPTAPGSYALLTFRDRQPAILFSFLGDPGQMIVHGKSGEWTIRTVDAYKGWIRLSLPFGLKAVNANTAGALGDLAIELEPKLSAFQNPAPLLKSLVWTESEGIIQGVWTFDRPGALVPPPLSLAREGGMRPIIKSGLKPANADLEDGPSLFCVNSKLVVQWVVPPALQGRALAGINGEWPVSTPDSPLDAVRLLMLAGAPPTWHDQVKADLDKWTNGAVLVKEPNTQQSLPFDHAGAGLLESATAALQAMALARSENRLEDANPWVTSLGWRVDARSWMLDVSDPALRSEASARLAVASALSNEPEVRGMAVLLQTGLAAESVRPLYARKRELEIDPTGRSQFWFPWRTRLFSLDAASLGENTQEDALESPLRLLKGPRVLTQVNGRELIMEFETAAPGPFEIQLAYPAPLRFIPAGSTNVLQPKLVEKEGTWLMQGQAEKAGSVRLMIKIDPAGPLVPTWFVPRPSAPTPPASPAG
jgi:hypothetical protein